MDLKSHNEIWKDIPGYNGKYQASNFGNIRSVKNNKIIILKASYAHGYKQVVLYFDKKLKTRKVHRCVLEAFCGLSHMEINHINGIRDDNRLINLEYTSRSENQKHAYKINPSYVKKIQGSNHKGSILNESQVIRIKIIFKNIIPEFGYIMKIAKSLNVSDKLIRNIIHNKSWRHICV